MARIAESMSAPDLRTQGPQKYFHGYNPGPVAIGLLSLYDDYHNNKVTCLTEQALLNNSHLSTLTEVLSHLYTELKNSDKKIDLTKFQPAIKMLREIYAETAAASEKEFPCYDSNRLPPDCPFPEDISSLSPDEISEIAQKLEALRAEKQRLLPQLMTQMQAIGQLHLSIVEIMRELTKVHIDGLKYVTNNTSRG